MVMEPCSFTRLELIDLKKAIKKEELDCDDFFFKAASTDVIPKRFEKHVSIMLEKSELDRCKQCGCTIAEHASTISAPSAVAEPTAVASDAQEEESSRPIYHECTLHPTTGSSDFPPNTATFFKQHLDHLAAFHQREVGENTSLADSSRMMTPGDGFLMSASVDERFLERAHDDGWIKVSRRLGNSLFKCDDDKCHVFHEYPPMECTFFVDNADLPTTFMFYEPQIRELGSTWTDSTCFCLWHVAAFYVAYVLDHFGKAPDGTPRTIQESIDHHVNETQKDREKEGDPIVELRVICPVCDFKKDDTFSYNFCSIEKFQGKWVGNWNCLFLVRRRDDE